MTEVTNDDPMDGFRKLDEKAKEELPKAEPKSEEPPKDQKEPEVAEPKKPVTPLPDRPVEDEKWRDKQAKKEERRNEEKEWKQKVESDFKSLSENVVTKKDLDELKGLISNISVATTPNQQADAE